MKLWKVAACVGAGALCVVTGGLAAPAVGAAIGSTFMGLSGAAATSAGLAALGGGSLAVGGAGMAGGTALVSAIAGGIGAGAMAVTTTLAEGTKAKKENSVLREKLRNSNESEATKQEIIKQLNKKVERLQAELKAEKDKSNASAEKI
jgi:uncharacterized protein HemX